jgi:tetratricopeptide (TPR) repeat protein
MADSQRIEDLRRRVQKDPASIAFAQLAEECRRAGLHQEAVAVCRAGLALHPGYASARVTLGRALLELNDLDTALVEFEHVLRSAPDNLAAIRSLADIHRRQGSLALALERYRAALALARNDPDLQEIVAELAREVEPATPEPDVQAAGSIEEPLAADQPTASSAQGRQVIARLEQWLDAIHVARAQPRS